MNIQYIPTPAPLKVLVVNPLTPASQLSIVKIFSGIVFGNNQMIDLIMLVYTNELKAAEAFKLELMACAFSCMNSIKISSGLPSVSDAEVFCFITNFPNPNYIDFSDVDSSEYFDTFYLIIKVAHNLSMLQSTAQQPLQKNEIRNEEHIKVEEKRRKPIFMADGLVAMDILKSFSKKLPTDVFFCPTPLMSISKSILADYLKVQCNVINNVLVWAANDKVFHVEVEQPFIIHDISGDGSQCDWDRIGKEALHAPNMDHTQFNASWMKKDFIERIAAVSCKNPYGCIYKAEKISKTLQAIWMTRSSEDGTKSYCSMGVISDGSLGTIKGLPYVLPLIISGENWSVNKAFEEDFHVKLQMKKINKAVKEQHEELIGYCKNFLEENIINQAFVPDNESSVFSMIEDSGSNVEMDPLF